MSACLKQFPNAAVEEQTLFNLYYCYTKLGDTQKANETKKLMETRFGNGKLNSLLKNPVPEDTARKKEGAPLYEEVYNLFIEGRFAEALDRKKNADSLYGKYYWTPQLLYIEAVYQINQRNDSAAIVVLNNINTLYPGTPMADKARNMVDVLSRRKQIEEYLTNLQVERIKEDSVVAPVGTPMVQGPVVLRPANTVPAVDSAGKKPAVVNKPLTAAPDSAMAVKKPSAPLSSSFVFAPTQPHYVVLVMDKVDPVYVNEAKNAFGRYNREKYYNRTIDINPLPLTDDTRFMLIGPLDDAAMAIDYMQKAQKLAAADIIPWMPAAKYSFIIVSANNLELIKNNKDLPAYKKFLAVNFKDFFK